MSVSSSGSPRATLVAFKKKHGMQVHGTYVNGMRGFSKTEMFPKCRRGTPRESLTPRGRRRGWVRASSKDPSAKDVRSGNEKLESLHAEDWSSRDPDVERGTLRPAQSTEVTHSVRGTAWLGETKFQSPPKETFGKRRDSQCQ